MSKSDKNKSETIVVDKAINVVVKFKSVFKNLVVAGTNIVFRDGFYETDVADEIELLMKNSLVFEVKEETEAGE